MKYTSSVDINAPLNRVIELFNDPINLPQWMPKLIHSELISGTLGKTGAVGRLTMKDGSKKYEVIETVTMKNLPSIFARTYQIKNILLTIKDSFISTGDNLTRYISENEVKLTGSMKFIGFLVQHKFKTQTNNQLRSFKRFVEKQA